MPSSHGLKLLVLILLLAVNLSSCKYNTRRRRFTKNFGSRYLEQPLNSFSGVEASSRFFPWRHRLADIYTNANTVNIEDEPYSPSTRERRQVYYDKKIDQMKDERGPYSIHDRVNAIRRMVQSENEERPRSRTRRSSDDIDHKLDSLVFRYRLKRSDSLLRKSEFNKKAAEDERISQDVNRQIAKIKEETVNEMNMSREPMKKREQGDKAEKRLNFLLRLKSCGIH